MAPETHGHIICSELMSYQWTRSFRVAKEKIEHTKGDIEGEEEKVS